VLNGEIQARGCRWLVALLIGLSPWLFAVDAEQGEGAGGGLKEEIAELREKVESSEQDDAVKAPVVGILDEASTQLKSAADYGDLLLNLQARSDSAEDDVERLEAELAALLPVGDEDLDLPDEAPSLRGQLEAERATVAQLETQLEEADRKLEELRELPVKVASRLPQATTELAGSKQRLSSMDEASSLSPALAADRLLLEAEIEALEGEVALLGLQQIGQPLREKRATLERRLLRDRLERGRWREGELERELDLRLQSEAEQMRERVTALIESSKDPGVAELAEGLLPLVAHFEATTESIRNTTGKAQAMSENLEDLRRESQRLRKQVEFGGNDGAFSQVFLDRQRRLEARSSLDFGLKQLDEELSVAQLEGFRLEDLMGDQAALAQEWSGVSEAAPVLELRTELLARLTVSQRALIQDLARLSVDQQSYRNLTVEFSEFLSHQLFLSRSSPPIGTSFFRDMPRASRWVIAREHWTELWRALKWVPVRHGFEMTLAILAFTVLLLARRRIRASIAKSGKRIRKISTDRLIHTVRALFNTLLLALPLPLALGFLAWSLLNQPMPDPWVRGLASWLGWSAWSVMWIFTLRELAREGGVGREHFGWHTDSSESLCRALVFFVGLYLPALLVAGLTLFDSNASYFDSVGRLGLIVAQCGMAWAFWRMFHPSTGVIAEITQEMPSGQMPRWGYFWIGVAVGFPLLLAAMTAVGYGITSLVLVELFHSAMRWVALGVIIYGLLLRGFMIRTRRIGLQEALERRRARRDAESEGAEEVEENRGEVVTVDDEEVEMDLKEVAAQMRSLLRSLVGIGVLLAIVYRASAALPLEQVGGADAVDRITWLGFFHALLVAAVAVNLIRNLPALLDLAGMRSSGVSPGARYAVATLCQYAVGAVALLLVTRALAVDWSQLGWMAAALSVGLGFGLQEIVANFVCGIILLFERPMRVGDVVTIGEVTGTVSKIRMRATTITNWDRQEFVVPNKDFVTGSLINWTLSSPLNRVTLNVGVAYGTDTVEARRILAEIAAAHPAVLEDPGPQINFESFGDSTLDLSIRCYLPNMDNRMRTVTELNEEIDRRFGEAGIEIAFPQRDLHIRSMTGKGDDGELLGNP